MECGPPAASGTGKRREWQLREAVGQAPTWACRGKQGTVRGPRCADAGRSPFLLQCPSNTLLRKFNVIVKVVCVFVTWSSPTLCDSEDCSPPGSSVHGILQVRILEWVAMPFSRGSS